MSVAKALEQLHYTRHSLDNTMSTRLLHTYIESLDYGRLFFTQKDIAEFERKYNTELDDDIFLGDLVARLHIYDLYLKRVEARVAKIKELIKTEKFDFTGKGTIEVSRQKSPWPKDEAEADSLWHDRIENEMLTENLGRASSDSKKADKARWHDRCGDDDRRRQPRRRRTPEASSPSVTTGCCAPSTSRPRRTRPSFSSTRWR